jgi:3-deoxy-D-manno-octulosonate 8-phosphate phosphatase (KDO 8-P phosphatase)
MDQSKLQNTRLSRIRAIAFDVDGVFTDGGFWWGPDGQEWKRFSFSDVMGVSLAKRAGIVIALISGEDSPLVDRYAQKMQIQHVFKGCRDKAKALREFAAGVDIELSDICFMGDDVNDLPAMKIAGVAAAPSTSASDVLAFVDFISKSNGGNGAVRELIESVLLSRGVSAQDVYSKA